MYLYSTCAYTKNDVHVHVCYLCLVYQNSENDTDVTGKGTG